MSNDTPMLRGVRAYDQFAWGASHVQSAALLLARLAWGWQLVESGYGHLTHVAETVKAFTQWGVPFPTVNVYISGTTELVGGILLMIGLAARLISIPLFFNFCVAYLTASADTVKHLFTQNPDPFINDSAFPFLVLSVLIFAFGPGWFSVDGLIRKLIGRRREVVVVVDTLPARAV